MTGFFMWLALGIPWMVVCLIVHACAQAAQESKDGNVALVLYGCGLFLAGLQIAGVPVSSCN